MRSETVHIRPGRATDAPALAFHAGQGFAGARRTDGDNEKRLPDLELVWRRG